MRNIAKCKVCHEVIESFHSTDYVECKCGEISVFEGSSMRCAAKNWDNFRRLDDEGNEILVSFQETEDVKQLDNSVKKISRAELIQMLEEMQKSIERLPVDALYQPISHADFSSLLMLLSAIFKCSE